MFSGKPKVIILSGMGGGTTASGEGVAPLGELSAIGPGAGAGSLLASGEGEPGSGEGDGVADVLLMF